MANWYFIIVLIWLFAALPTFFVLLRIPVPFGRHTRSGWGALIPNRLAWFVMELPALLVMPAVAFAGNPDRIGELFIVFWVVHYVNRTCIFPLRIKTTGKGMPLIVMVSAFGFNIVNGFLCGYYFGHYAHYDPSHLTSPYFIFGILLFGGGLLLNVSSDNILINLRRSDRVGYTIPQGGLFQYVSCPNLLGEILEWLGYALMTLALPTLAFALWTIANLLPRALAHHRWYQEHFVDYPPRRRALIPFIL